MQGDCSWQDIAEPTGVKCRLQSIILKLWCTARQRPWGTWSTSQPQLGAALRGQCKQHARKRRASSSSTQELRTNLLQSIQVDQLRSAQQEKKGISAGLLLACIAEGTKTDLCFAMSKYSSMPSSLSQNLHTCHWKLKKSAYLFISKLRMDHKIRSKKHLVAHICWHQVRQFQLS